MRQWNFVLKRILELLLLAIFVSFATFWLSAMIPGDFFSTHLLDSSTRAETVEQLRHSYGLDQPLHIRYWHWLTHAARMDLGYSLFYRRPVSSIVADALLKTLWIGVPALIIGFSAGILLGTVHESFKHGLAGKILDFAVTTGLSLPSLLLGLLGLMLAARTHWLPLGGTNSLTQNVAFLSWIMDRIRHLLLPVTCLSIPIAASVERIQFAAVQSPNKDLYLQSARARGLGSGRIFFHYLLRPGLNPVLSISGPMIGGVLSGSLVLEVIFSWPGLGQVTYDALFNNDLFLLAGCVLGSSVLLIAGNLIADFALATLDPRTRSLLRRSRR